MSASHIYFFDFERLEGVAEKFSAYSVATLAGIGIHAARLRINQQLEAGKLSPAGHDSERCRLYRFTNDATKRDKAELFMMPRHRQVLRVLQDVPVLFTTTNVRTALTYKGEVEPFMHRAVRLGVIERAAEGRPIVWRNLQFNGVAN